MKKVLLLLTIMVTLCTYGWAQLGVGQQMQNNNFESWTTISWSGSLLVSGGTADEPVNWHSINDATGSLADYGKKVGFVTKSTDNHPNGTGNYSVKLTALNVTVALVTKLANGSVSSGRFNAGDSNPAGTKNCTYTSTNSGYNMPMTAYPDSVYVWVKTTSSSNKAHFRLVLHNSTKSYTSNDECNAIYQDPNPKNSSNSVVRTDSIENKGKVVADAKLDFISTSWTQKKVPFIYTNNNTTPSYILATFSTNGAPGGGAAGDALYFDDVVLIYNTRLESLKINGSNSNNIPGFNPDITNYNLCVSQLPANSDVVATPQSAHATATITHHATLAQPYTTIKVTHLNQENDNLVTKIYTINYSITPTISFANGNSYTVCAGESVTIAASGADSYTWSNGQSGSSITVTPPASGSYTVTGTTGGCSATATAHVTVNPLPNVTINGSVNGTASICSGNSVTLIAGGASSYVWNYNNSTATSINVSTGSTYTVTGTTNNCSASASVVVTAHDAPTVTINGPTYLCSGTTATLTASGLSNYTWSGAGSGTGSTLDITAGGSYTVSGTDANGCSGSASHNVTGRTTPTITITGATAICSGTSAELTANVNQPNATITWTGGSHNANLTINAGGTYSATASLNGCESTASVTVTESTTPEAPTATGASACKGETVTLTATAASGATCYWYANQSTSTEAGTGNTFITPELNDNTTYYVSAKNEDGCFSTRVPVTATIHPLPSAPNVSNTSICGEGDITLTAIPNNNVHWYTDNAGLNMTTAEQHVTATTAFYAAVIDGNGCRSALNSMTVTVYTVPGTPTAITPEPICSNGTASNVSLTATPGENGTGVKWYDSTMTTSSSANPFTARNITKTTTYYVVSTTTASTCESNAVPVTIVVNPIPASPMLSCMPRCGAGEVTLSANGQNVMWYTADDQLLSEGTTYTTNIESTTTFKASVTSLGCESPKASVIATVKPNYPDMHDYKTACGSYTWEGNTYEETGNYKKHLTSSLGCDSTVTLHLTINNGYEHSFDTTVCDQFVWQNQIYTSTGSDTKHLTSKYGCDSTVTYHFTIRHHSEFTDTVTVCSNDFPFTYAGKTISEGGQHTIKIPNAEGCDSIITLYVIDRQQPDLATVTNKSVCGAGTNTLNVTVGTNGTTCKWYTTTESDSAFYTGTSYSTLFTETTTYYVSSFNSNTQCESGRQPITLTVNNNPAEPQVDPVSRCGSGAMTLTATIDDYATTCRWYLNMDEGALVQYTGTSYTRNFNASLTYYVESFNESTNCKSGRVPVTATVNEIPATPQVTSGDNCGPLTADLTTYVTSSTDMLRWYDSNEELLSENAHYSPTIAETTTFLVSNYNNATHCESPKQSLTITINNTYEPQTIRDTVCQNTTYNKYGIHQTFESTGEQTFTLNTQSSAGCDSLVTLYVYVKPVITKTISATDCDSYNWNGSIYDHSGTFQQTFTAANGCDSVVTLNLTIHESVATEFDIAQCVSYTWNDQTYTQSGDYNQTFTAVNGCDSVVTLHLIIYPAYDTEFSMSACEEYTWNGTTYRSSNDYTQSFQSVHGCDSVVTMHLTIYEPVVLNLEDEICAGETYTGYGFDTTFTQPNIYHLTHIGKTVHQCDSTTNVVLTVHPTFDLNIQKMICENSSFVFNGDTLREAGAYTDTLQTIHGCDSIVNLTLTIGSQFRDTINAHICAGSSYHEYGFNIDQPTATLYDSLELQATNDCDSVSVLHLFVHYPDTAHLYETLCQDDSYRQHGFNETLNKAGDTTLVRHTTTPYGCDSTIMVHLTVNPKSAVTLYDTICAETRYDRNGFDTTYDVAGNYTLVNHNTNQYLCDSVTTLNLTVLPTYHSAYDQIACVSFTWNDSTYEKSGDYTQTFSSIHGCDSIVTIHLTILQPDTTLKADTVCGSYTWNDTTYYQSGVYEQTLTNIHQCDSTVILNLTILPTSVSSFDTTVCVSFTWNDTTYYQSGVYEQHLVNSFGCDSVVTVNLTVNSADTVHIPHVACSEYTWNGQTYMQSGEYTQSFLNANGCDSTVTLHLTLYTPDTVEIPMSVCDSIVWNQITYRESGNYTQILTNSHNCDSTVTMHLTVNHSYEIDTIVNTCSNLLPFMWDDNDQYAYFAEGDYDIAFTTVSGCDSIIHLHLNVNPRYVQDTTVTVCQAEVPYFFDADHSFSMTGDYIIRLTSESGCDSIWNLHLTVTPITEHTDTKTTCRNQLPYVYMDSLFYEAGLHDIILPTEDNCLSITHLTLIVNDTTHGYDTVTVCEENLPYFYGTTELIQTGDYDIHFSDNNHCDSLISVHFTVIPTAHGVEEMYVCEGDFPITFGGTPFDSEGVYDVTFHREGLCDSIVTLTLHEASKYLITEIDSVCDHELPYTWRNMEFTQTGVYYDSSLVSIHGCDSVYRLLLTVNETQVIVSNPIVLCHGESETWRGMTLSESGTYRDTVASATTGCREIHEVTVTVHPTYIFHDTVTICDNELPYLWRDRSLNEAGIYTESHQTVGYGCDSIYRITLFVNPTAHHDESVNVCDYDLPYLWHGQSLTESGIYYDTMTTTSGCDSTFTLNFTVYPSSHTMTDTTVCNTQLPIVWRGYPLSAAGTYFDTVPNTYGCNDVYEMHLSVNQSNTTTIYDTICQGGHYTLNGFDTLATQSGTLYDQRTLTNASGCDSIVNLILNVLPSYLFEVSAETCDNVPFQWHGGEFLIAGDYYDSLTTVNGCDSVYILHLSLNPTYEVYVSDSAMANHEYQYDNLVVTPSDSGTFQYDIQYYTIAHCDSVIHLTLSVAFNDGIDDYVTPEFSFFPNPTQAALNITGERMKRIHVYDLSGKLVLIADPNTPEQARINVNGFATGHYVVKVTLDDGNSISGKIIVDKR